MTRRLGKGDAQRGRARLALLVVTLTTTSLLLGLSPGGPLSSVLAAVNGTPTATTTETNSPAATSTPAAPSGASIELLNPSKYVTPIIVSNKADEDTSYHLVAWVSNANALVDPVVEFKITPASGTTPAPQTITGTRIGDTDVWHAFWDVTAQDDREYNLTAELFANNPRSSVDTDAEQVTVEKSRETVEMTYPTTAGLLGTFDPDGAGPMARGFVVDATVSADATGVRVFYGTSPPGTEQNWRRCTVQETVSFSVGGSRRIGCTVASGVGPNSITGVAAVATGTDPFNVITQNCDPTDVDPGPPPTCPTVDSGDAHRVTSYDQVATSVQVSPDTSSSNTGTCRVLTARVIDGQSRPIWRSNLDVHAVGPNDDLQFGDVANTTRDWQPPNAPGSHDQQEPTSNCGGSGTPPAQGEHQRPAANDEKHIETKPADQPEGGADTSGAFTFALRSAQPGTTNVEAWFDTNDNDLRETEPTGTATITWIGPTPTTTATSSTTTSPTTSPTATRSPTTTASATRSATTSPSATRSATATSTAENRTITLEPNRNSVVYGQAVIFSGAITSPNPGCETGQNVRLQQQGARAPGFSDAASATTDASGAYAISYQPVENATYRAVVDPSSQCQEAISSTRSVLVRVRVGLRASDNAVPKGSKVRLTVSVTPCGTHTGSDVVLERNIGRGFREVGNRELNATCKATFKSRVRKTSGFRASWPNQDGDHESGVSPIRKVRAVRTKRRNF